jgi:hypothetical protein
MRNVHRKLKLNEKEKKIHPSIHPSVRGSPTVQGHPSDPLDVAVLQVF